MRKLTDWAVFNLVVGVVGVSSIVLMEAIGGYVVEPGEDFVEPLAMLAGILFFAIGCNVVLLMGVVHLDNEQFHQRFRRVLKWCSGFATAPIWLAVLAFILNRK